MGDIIFFIFMSKSIPKQMSQSINQTEQIIQSNERNESKQITKLYEYIVPVIKESHRVIKQSNQMKENKSKQIIQSNERNESKQITKFYEYIVPVIKESHRVIKQSNQMKANKSKQIMQSNER